MASLKLSDSAFGTVGFTIDQNLDLQAISADLSAVLGTGIVLDNLDVSNVTLTELTASGRESGGLPIPGSTLTVGGFANFAFGANPAVTFFTTLAFTQQTVLAEDGAFFEIRDGDILSASENALRFDEWTTTFDFSGVGAGALEIFLDSIAPGDTVETPGGYQVIGNEGDTVIFGFQFGNQEQTYFGSNDYFLGEGENVFFGGFDNANVTGGSGGDVMFGGFGDSVLQGGGGDDSLFAEDGANLLVGGDGNDELFGGPGLDILQGGAGNDILFGGESFGSSDSLLEGGDGADWLYGSRGNHELTGGTGSDRFVFANDNDIVTRVEGEGGLLTINTGLNVSDGEVGTNVIVDFAAGEDLLVIGARDVQLDFQESASDFSLGFGESPAGGQQVFFDIFSFQVDASEFFTIQDTEATITESSVLLRVEQSDYLVVDGQQLAGDIFTDPQTEATRPASFEIVYRDAGQSLGQNHDRFFGLALTPQVEGAPLGGQDKFDLTALGLTDFEAATGARQEVSDILFSFVDFFAEESFTLDELLFQDAPIEELVAADFFLDADAGLYRALHAEYGSNGSFDEIVVYIDADGDGDLSLASDLVFRVEGIDGNNSPGSLTAADLFNDPAADGSGTGIFIFNESQYEFWLNDEFLVPVP